ncbi:MAG TPA: outer membrane beta-barrel protein [Mesorhizobium sp.]
MAFAPRTTMLAIAMLAGGPAFAADLYVEEAPEATPAPVVAVSGWYLRGDIGYVFKSKSQGNWDFYNQFPGVQGIDDTLRYDHLNLGASASFGGGVGYRFNDYLRTDATLDFFHAKVSGGTACPSYVRNDAAHGFLPFSDCHYDNNASANVWAPMVNAYVDLPSMGAITPYLGLGIGAAFVDYGKLNVQEVCGDCPAGFSPYSATNEGLSSWRLAGSAMAGLSYRVSDHFLLDAGYKYTRVGSGKAFAYDAHDAAHGATGTQIRDNGFNFHALRVGVRYEVN